MRNSVAIVDYGAGNVFNVQQAFRSQGISAVVVSDVEGLHGHSHAVLPGVGAFRFGIERLREKGLSQPLREWAEAGRPLLAICLGLQLLAERGSENGVSEGLGIIKGNVVKLQRSSLLEKDARIPHTGWADLIYSASRALESPGSMPQPGSAYFNHSYYLENAQPSGIVAQTSVGGMLIPAWVSSGSVTAVQFHPEKSGSDGLALLEGWFRSTSARPSQTPSAARDS